MENFPSEWEMKNLVKELSQGRELANQLLIHLNYAPSNETRDYLLHQILSSYDNALSTLQHSRYAAAGAAAAPPPPAASDSPLSLAGSPHRSDDSDPDFKDQSSKKKKESVTSWTQKIKVCTETGAEGQLDDGYGWRKYGQKDILGAKYPRGYYRCTQRHGRGCLATKQVQCSNDDPTIFEITYRRKHTCNPRANPASTNNHPPASIPNPYKEDPNPLTPNLQQIVSGSEQPEPLFNIQTSLRVITQDLDTNVSPSSFDPFNFPSSSNINLDDNIHVFGSDYFPISTNLSNDSYGGLFPNLLHTSESDELSPIVAPTTSTTSSPTLSTHFSFGSNFRFGNPGYYP